MADDALRALERRAAQGDPDARVAYLTEGLRAGKITRGHVTTLALLGDPAARAVAPVDAPHEIEAWAQALERAGGHEVGVRAAIAAARVAFAAHSASEHIMEKGEATLVAAERWALAPNAAAAQVCGDLGNQAGASSLLFVGSTATGRLSRALGLGLRVAMAVIQESLAFEAIREAAGLTDPERVRVAIAAELLPWLWNERDPLRARVEGMSERR